MNTPSQHKVLTIVGNQENSNFDPDEHLLRLAIHLSRLDSDTFDRIVAELASRPFNVLDPQQVSDAFVNPQLVQREMAALEAKQTTADRVELSVLSYREYLDGGSVDYLHGAVTFLIRACEETPDTSPKKVQYLLRLSGVLHTRLIDLRDPSDCDALISVMQKVLKLMPDAEDDKPLQFHNLGDLLIGRFSPAGKQPDLASALEAYQHGVAIAPVGHPYRATALTGLGRGLMARYTSSHNTDDHNAAILALQEAVGLSFTTPELRAMALKGLAQALEERYARQKLREDIDAAIAAHHEAAELIPDADSNKPSFVRRLVAAIHTRFTSITHSVSDLDSMILALRPCAKLPNLTALVKAQLLADLGSTLSIRFDHVGHLPDIEESIATLRESHQLNPQTSTPLSTLGVSLLIRFERLGTLEDLDAAIAAQRKAADELAQDDNDRSSALHNLGNAYQARFEHLGRLEDIDAAITAHKGSIDLLLDVNEDNFERFSMLGTAYHRRFDHLRENSDMVASLTFKQAAVQLTAPGHPARPQLLNGLGVAWMLCYQNTSQVEALDNAIAAVKEAVDLTPNSHSHKGIRLHNLVYMLQERFDRDGKEEDISAAIVAAEQAVALLPDESHWRKAASLQAFGVCLYLRYGVSNDPADIDSAISAMQCAVDTVPFNHTARANFLQTLGSTYLARFEERKARQDIDMAIEHLGAIAQATDRPLITQFPMIVKWARLCAEHREPAQALAAYRLVIEQIPRVIWRGAKLHRRVEDTQTLRNVVPEAVAAAVSAGDLAAALEWAEAGRCLIWGQLLELRAPIDALHDVAPALADELQAVSRELEQIGTTDSGALQLSVDSAKQEVALEAQGQRHRKLAARYEELLSRVQALPDFEDFSRPKRVAELRAVARNGPVVLINVHRTRCDALAVVPGSEEIVHIPLPDFSETTGKEMLRSLVECLQRYGIRTRAPLAEGQLANLESPSTKKRMQTILSLLWLLVVQPILYALEDQVRTGLILFHLSLTSCQLSGPKGAKLPRITWCANGPLAFLPLHAAGIHDPADRDYARAFDRVVSSYTPNLTALINAQKLKHIPCPRVAAVSQAETPGSAPLPGTIGEVLSIQKCLPNLTWLDGAAATRDSVLSAMKEHEWIHLACHAEQDPAMPLRSAFLLEDGGLQLLDIMKHSFANARLAVLSACQTAAGDERVPEEVLHLGAAMLTAGYKSVIATMWSIGDLEAPIVAERLYSHLVNEAGGNSDDAAYALHYAVGHLRQQIGERAYIRWLPFIHIGA
jgi:tetratricopeptide (TPR) repeat protein